MKPFAPWRVHDELLFKRELEGTRLHLGLKAGLLIFLSFSNVTLEILTGSLLKVGSVYLVMLALTLGAFWRLGRPEVSDKRLHLIGFASLLIDLALIVILPLAWYFDGIGASEPRIYVLKTAGPLVAVALIVISGLALRPPYPLLLALGSVLYFGGLFFWALEDPHSKLTNGFVEDMMGPALNPGLFWLNNVGLLLVGAVVAYTAFRARRTVIEATQLERANGQLGRYFSPAVAQAISGAKEEFFKPGGRRQPVAVMFCDLRGFTAISETLPPEEVVAFLSQYHERMVGIIFEHGGTLDKFLGDGILATFGTPEPDHSDLKRAVSCGLAMKQALAELNVERQTQGQPALGQGIGIHYGEAIVGNIGTSDRLEYTVIGDTVNLASRIETACKTLSTDFLVSQSVETALRGQFAFKPMGEVEVKGQSKPVVLYAFGE